MTENTKVAVLDQTHGAGPPMREMTPAITPMQMLQIAVERGADLDQLSKLMDLQERWERNEARKAFVAAKAAFKAEAPELSKNKHVSFENRDKSRTEYNHATLDYIAATVSPVLSKHGLAYSWETEQGDGGVIRVTCVLTHVLGHSERVTLQAGADQSGGKNNIQAVGSTVSYLERYTLLAVTGLATTDQDDDGEGSTTFITPDQKETIVGLLRETGSDVVKFLAYFEVPNVDVLPAGKFKEAVAMLNKKRSAK